jgi:hypothetical protein
MQSHQPERPSTPRWSATALAATSLLAAAAAWLLWEWRRRHPCNHWGPDARWLWAGCLLAAGWAVVRLWWRRLRPWTTATVLLAAGICAGTVCLLDHFNLLVSYEQWIARGMPGPWER